MCLAVPGKIISIIDNQSSVRMAKVDFAGITKDICLEYVPEANVGDYVIVHVGFALNKIDEKEAEETLKLIQEMNEMMNNEEQTDSTQ
ncbi:MAG: HypC/HybG/HupF family hydrogenase formation chaperone [Ignavibacteria bacterium]|nr:HypC/HybG/HupF family hydrogenase formation chaperone [Ignavibacteria bacterium]